MAMKAALIEARFDDEEDAEPAKPVKRGIGAVGKGKTKKKVSKEEEDWGEFAEEDWGEFDEAEPAEEVVKPKKKKKVSKEQLVETTTKPEDIEEGALVLYWGSLRGIIRDAFVPLDEFWVCDEVSGETVKDEQGEIVRFKSAELQLVAAPPIAKEMEGVEPLGPTSGVFILGTEEHMMKILAHFGAPDETERSNPQQLLAIPTHMCDPDKLLTICRDGVDDPIIDLAKRLRPDINVALRTFHLKQAIELLSPDLQAIADYYCLGSVQLPYGKDSIDEAGEWEAMWQKDVCNQIDIGVTARDRHLKGESPEATAARVLGETTGICIDEGIWSQEAQRGVRRSLSTNMVLKFPDANGASIHVVIIPSDAQIADDEEGILTFSKGAIDYAQREKKLAAPLVTAAKKDAPNQGKTVSQLEKEQDEFAHLPKLPAGWIRVRSKSSGEVYFFNKETQKSSFELPLPEGWTKQVSKTTGKTYYFNAKKRQSTFEPPTE